VDFFHTSRSGVFFILKGAQGARRKAQGARRKAQGPECRAQTFFI